MMSIENKQITTGRPVRRARKAVVLFSATTAMLAAGVARLMADAGTTAAERAHDFVAASGGSAHVVPAETTPPSGPSLIDVAPVEALPATPVAQVAPATMPAVPMAPAAAPAAPTTVTAPMATPAPAAPMTDKPGPATRPAGASDTTVMLENVTEDQPIQMLVGRSLVLKNAWDIGRLADSQPDIITYNLLDTRTILVTGKKVGVTQLILWDADGHSKVVYINVEVDLNALTAQLKKTFPGSEIEVTGSNGAIMLRGRVPNLEVAEQATELVGSYAKVLNFLELAGGQQVVLQVRFAEVSRSVSTSLGFNAFGTDGKFQAGLQLGPGGSPIGGVATNQQGTAISSAVSIFGGGKAGSTALEGFIQALRTNNLLRVLAEPNLIAYSGQDASFLAGGEFPIPVPQAGGSGSTAITVEYKQFGVRLNFLPVVLGDGRIRLKVSPEVSDLDFSRSVSFNGFTIPSLTKRNVTTTLELNEGQTFAVAGLLNNRVNSTSNNIPLLGDLPVLGALFRSVQYQRNETELVVLVTPRVVSAMNPSQVPELPGERWVYPTENELFIKGYLGGPASDPRSPAQAGPAKFHGPYGFTPVTHPAESGK